RLVGCGRSKVRFPREVLPSPSALLSWISPAAPPTRILDHSLSTAVLSSLERVALPATASCALPAQTTDS
ncbi:hypothetical protein PMAYCL1PPCAC_04328, partial [Pristionchus mayeri]